MERLNSGWFLRFVLLPALGGIFIAGWQQAQALPVCVNCDCKDMYHWQPSTLPPNEGFGIWSAWNGGYMKHGLVGIWAAPPCNSIPTAVIADYPRDICIECKYTCTVTMPVNVREVDCDDILRCPRKNTATLTRRQCSP